MNLRTVVFLISIIALQLSDLTAQKDSFYIEKTSQPFTFGVHAKYRNNNARLVTGDQSYFHVHDEAILAGIRLRYKWLSSVISVPLIDDIRSDQVRPSTYSVTARAYPTHFYGQLNAQYVLLNESSPTTLLRNLSSLSDQPSIAQINALIIYGFDKDRLSLSAAYSFFERQRQSAGTWLVAGQFDGSWWNLPQESWVEWDQQPISFDRTNKLRYLLGGGYSHSWVFESFCINFLATSGVELISSNRKQASIATPIDQSIEFRYVPISRAMGSVIYYYGHYYLGMTGEYTFDRSSDNLYDTRFRGSFIRLSCGRYL